MLSWIDDEHFVVGSTTFRVIDDEVLTAVLLGTTQRPRPDSEPSRDRSSRKRQADVDFVVAKPRAMVEHYAKLIGGLRPQHIFELGVLQGGSTALLAELARPRRLVGIDLKPPRQKHRVEEFARSRGLGDAVRIYGNVDQGDRGRLAEIVDDVFEGDELDLVLDDCSHQYHPTRASFNELFPRLREGGLYIIEDWPWAHTPQGVEPLEGFFPDQVPLTRLVFELVLAIPSTPGLITDLTVDETAIAVTRGDAPVNPSDFEISACSNPRGRELLAPAE
jgi:predicted O-methyltransferase YrrM